MSRSLLKCSWLVSSLVTRDSNDGLGLTEDLRYRVQLLPAVFPCLVHPSELVHQIDLCLDLTVREWARLAFEELG